MRSTSAATAAQIAAMPYGDLQDWAGQDFERLVAAAKARDYRPEWIGHQIAGVP